MLCVQATEQAKEEVKRVLAVLNQHLNTRTFLVGERVSLADITVVCSLLWLYKQVSTINICFRFPLTFMHFYNGLDCCLFLLT